MRRLVALVLLLGLLAAPVRPDIPSPGAPEATAAPTAEQAATLLGVEGPVVLNRVEMGVPGWDVAVAGRAMGHIGSTWEIARSVGYSGRPLEVLVGISPDARITGALLVRHNEPVLTLGISDADIAAYVAGFEGYDLTGPPARGLTSPGLPDVISRATVSTGVIRDGILRTARTLAIGRDLIGAGGGIDRLGFIETDWPSLLAQGALAEVRVNMAEAATALAGAKVPIPPSDKPFLHLWAGIIDPPTVGQSLLGQQDFTRAIGGLGLGETALIVISSGLHSHRGTGWKASGVFDRLTVVQGDARWHPTAEAYQMLKRLVADGTPEAKEISLFHLPASFDATLPLRLEIKATRPTATGEVSMIIPLDYTLPEAFRLVPPPPDEPLWVSIWAAKRVEAVLVAGMLGCLTLILFAQEWITRRPRLWRYGRMGFLAVALLGLGWGLNGQLSVVQVVAFIHSLLTGFRWETFLIEPVIFLLWGFVALGLLFWGRGVYCGWLCPFGALQELLNNAAQLLGIRQIAVPQALHERLWVIKYTLFVGILALSFYSMRDALVLAEAEPFKTAISLRMVRAWPFLLFVAALLVAGLFIERFYCRYLCPLGAGLAIPAKLKIFDWLKRRPQCGRECRLCETKCTVGAIDPLGRINPNECVLCLRCQVIMNDDSQCPVLKRRARTEATP
jgi:NosR/NirI family transcriptional regulator, nitrite reductase regulator